MKTTTFAGLALTAGLVLAAPAVALAQPAPAPAGADARPMRPTPTPEQRAERRAERLRTVLQLRPEQEGALREYVAALQAGRPDVAARRQERGELRQMPTPERLQAQRARLAERMARFDRRAAATTRFYAQLNPAQQKAFDAMAARRGGGKFRRGPGGRHGGWDGGGRRG